MRKRLAAVLYRMAHRFDNTLWLRQYDAVMFGRKYERSLQRAPWRDWGSDEIG